MEEHNKGQGQAEDKNDSFQEQRLESLRPPRDLTLSAPRKTQHKKTFAPNLKVVRNKNKLTPFEGGGGGGGSTGGARPERRGDKGHKNEKNKDRKHKSDSHVLKSRGVFSEGMAAITKYSSRVGYSGLQKTIHGDAGLQKPVFDKQCDKQISQDLSGIDIKDILKEEGDEDSLMATFCPIKLPLVSKCSEINEADTKSEKMFHQSADLFRTKTTPTLLLMQFPDNLPGRGPENTETLPEHADLKANNNVCKVHNLEEGRVGKIVIYKSGKVKLVIGNTDYDLNIGMQPRFQQDVLSVSTNTDERNGSAVNIGSIQNKLIIVPQWETLFQRAATSL